MAGLNATFWLQRASVLGVLCGGALADRWSAGPAGGCGRRHRPGPGVPFLFLTGWTMSVPVLVLAMAGFGFVKGLYDANIWASLYDVVEPRHRATAVGLMNSVAWLGGGAVAVAVGAAADHFGLMAPASAPRR